MISWNELSKSSSMKHTNRVSKEWTTLNTTNTKTGSVLWSQQLSVENEGMRSKSSILKLRLSDSSPKDMDIGQI